MRRIVYYVATSIDGYISRIGNDISGFVPGGNGIDQYLADLQDFDTVIMGRKTYEFGYQYGLVPGQIAYPHMMHYIFSSTLKFENQHQKLIIQQPAINFIKDLKKEEGSDIYLCGGGLFAGWLLEHQMIDTIKIKLNPLLIGQGVRLFGESKCQYNLQLKDNISYDHGLQILEYDIVYPL